MIYDSIDRVQKLKDARSEASKEIEDYKKAKEREFRAFEASVRSFTLP
jgi:V-type H+-transporting ATPase subunit G